MTSLRIRQYGSISWTYIYIKGEDEGIIQAIINRLEESFGDLHVQQLNDEGEWE